MLVKNRSLPHVDSHSDVNLPGFFWNWWREYNRGGGGDDDDDDEGIY